MDAAEIMESIRNDKRTPDELFKSLCNRLKQMRIESGNPVSDEEAIQGTRRLINFYTFILESDIKLDTRAPADAKESAT